MLSGDPFVSPNRNPFVTAADGLFAWTVPNGEYRVEASHPDYAPGISRTVVVPPAAEDVDVGLEPLAAEEDPHGEPVAPPVEEDGRAAAVVAPSPPDRGIAPTAPTAAAPRPVPTRLAGVRPAAAGLLRLMRRPDLRRGGLLRLTLACTGGPCHGALAVTRSSGRAVAVRALRLGPGARTTLRLRLGKRARRLRPLFVLASTGGGFTRLGTIRR